MKRKLILLLASCSLAVAIIVPVLTIDPAVNNNTQMLVEIMGHGAGGD